MEAKRPLEHVCALRVAKLRHYAAITRKHANDSFTNHRASGLLDTSKRELLRTGLVRRRKCQTPRTPSKRLMKAYT